MSPHDRRTSRLSGIFRKSRHAVHEEGAFTPKGPTLKLAPRAMCQHLDPGDINTARVYPHTGLLHSAPRTLVRGESSMNAPAVGDTIFSRHSHRGQEWENRKQTRKGNPNLGIEGCLAMGQTKIPWAPSSQGPEPKGCGRQLCSHTEHLDFRPVHFCHPKLTPSMTFTE